MVRYINAARTKKPKRLTWAQEQRMLFIAERLTKPGYLTRGDLTEKFRISLPQATNDFKMYEALYPHSLVYDLSMRRYTRSGKR